MKNFLLKLPLICLLAVVCGIFVGCDPTEKTPAFSVSVKETGPEYVNIEVKATNSVEIAYILDTKEKKMDNPVMIFASGESMTVNPNDVIRISKGMKENTQYYLYVVAKLDAQNYSEIFTLPFKTTEYSFDELLTVVDQDYDGYKMRITIPKETRQRGNAIRYNQACIMMYNYMVQGGTDDYFSLLYNAGKYTEKDVTLTYSEADNWFQTDEDSDGDGENDWDTQYNPISPGEPVVFVAGEFAWMEDSPEYETENFKYPSGWDSGYYLPMIDESYYGASDNSQSNLGIVTEYSITRPLDDYWTGAFQRKHFRVLEPKKFDGQVKVELEHASPIDLVMNFYPDDNVYQYAVGIFDDAMYQQVLELCNGRKEYLQWAITSYFAAYTFGTRVAKEAVQMKLSTFYYQDAIGEDTEYHVLVTPMGDQMATIQNFQEYTFKTTSKTKSAPVIEVTPLESTPYVAKFNVKCTTAAEGNPVTECYYAANYKRDWLLAINSGSTYFSLVAGNKAYSYFSADDLELINSAEGLELAIPSVDGETTRVAVLGYNDEYTPNDLTSFKPTQIEDGECPGIADVTTPWLEMKDYVDYDFDSLIGDWTATATLKSASSTSGKGYTHKSKITITDNLNNYPSELPDSVYQIYKETSKYEKEKVDGLWNEFKKLADDVAKHRLEYQNRVLALGWLDADSYGRLNTYSPYDLFVDRKYSSVDVSSIFNDFGPKWYIEAVKDENGNVKLVAPIDSNFLPPAANWSVPFYFSGMSTEFYSITYGDGWTPSFPIEVSADKKTITIKPLEYTDSEGTTTVFYPQMIGIDNQMQQSILENYVVSEVVLTKGWDEKQKSSMSVPATRSSYVVRPEGDFPVTVYKPRTELNSVPLKQIEGSLVTVDQFKERADKFIEMTYKQNR